MQLSPSVVGEREPASNSDREAGSRRVKFVTCGLPPPPGTLSLILEK